MRAVPEALLLCLPLLLLIALDQFFGNPAPFLLAFLWFVCWFPALVCVAYLVLYWFLTRRTSTEANENPLRGSPRYVFVFLAYSLGVYVDGAISGARNEITESYMLETAARIEALQALGQEAPADLHRFAPPPILAYSVRYHPGREMRFYLRPYGPKLVYDFRQSNLRYDE